MMDEMIKEWLKQLYENEIEESNDIFKKKYPR